MAGCSQPGPAKTVTVPQYQAPKPGTPGAPYKVSQRCTGGDNAAVTISWGAASNAKYYEIYHSSGRQLAVASGTSVEIYDVPTYSPTGAYLTLYVKACNEAGCTQGPSATLWIDPCEQEQPQPADVDIIDASFSPKYPSFGQSGSATLTLRNSGGQGADVVISGKVFRAGTDCPVEGYFQQVTTYVGAGQTKTVTVPYSGTFARASMIDWTANANTCWQAGTNYGWLDCLFGIDYYPNQVKHYTLRNAIRLPD